MKTVLVDDNQQCDGTADYFHTKRDGSWWEHDARGIPLRRVCEKCKAAKLAGYRKEVLTNPNYETTEDIDAD